MNLKTLYITLLLLLCTLPTMAQDLVPRVVCTQSASMQRTKTKFQVLQFVVSPKNETANVLVKASGEADYTDWGGVDANGTVDRLLPVGTYQYRVVSDMYLPTESMVTLDGGDNTYVEQVTLCPDFGYLEVTCGKEFEGAEIYVDGNIVGRGRWNGRLKYGTHKVEARLTGYRSSEATLIVSPDTPTSYQLAAPEPITGNLYVRSTPSGAEIKLNGKVSGITPKLFKDILIGDYTIILKADGYRSAIKNVHIAEDAIENVDLALQKVYTDVVQEQKTVVEEDEFDIVMNVAPGSALVVRNRKQRTAVEEDEDEFDIAIDNGYRISLDVELEKETPVVDKNQRPAVEENAFDYVEQKPEFPGGPSALMVYICSNLKYPVVAQENGVQGRVIVGFVVDMDGSVKDVKVVKGVDPSLDHEAERVFKSMPNWIPGKANGKPVKTKYIFPVSFGLQ